LGSYPRSVEKLIEEFGRLPGVGNRTAERLALYLMRAPKEEALELADAIREVKQKVKNCSTCHNLSDTDPCHICSDLRRSRSVICVVEEPKDVAAIEKSGAYTGLYHVLMGRYNPLKGMDEANLTLGNLLRRTEGSDVEEVIIATNPNLEGDATAALVAKRLEGKGIRISRIARGMPQGSQIEHVSGAIITDALKGRRNLKES
jgi:recombination protein RecR